MCVVVVIYYVISDFSQFNEYINACVRARARSLDRSPAWLYKNSLNCCTVFIDLCRVVYWIQSMPHQRHLRTYNVYVNSLRFQWSAICHLLFGMAVSVIVYILAVFDVNAQLRCVWICVCASEYVEAHRSIMTHKIAVHAIVFR